ncbi:MAG: helix-turn-helix transcriptional regulator [Burkholderiales bacterium]|nr:helix-turn-helix transcriptional regulator [Burkholderiales bacterium]
MALTTTKQKQEIGARLRSERERLGYSELQIAQLLGIPEDTYKRFETGEADPGIFRMPRLSAIGFDVLYVITADRHIPGIEEDDLLKRFRELSIRGKMTVFNTMDALERLAPNIKRRIRTATKGSPKDTKGENK